MSTFSYVKFDDKSNETLKAFKTAFEGIETMIRALPDGPHKEQSIVNLEQSYMWIGKTIRDSQLRRECIGLLEYKS